MRLVIKAVQHCRDLLGRPRVAHLRRMRTVITTRRYERDRPVVHNLFVHLVQVDEEATETAPKERKGKRRK